jgi:PAS domain S-box-containing protein
MLDTQTHVQGRWGLAEQNAAFGIWDLDIPKGQVLYSAQWKALLGYPATDTPDSTAVWRARVHPDDLAAMVQALQLHLQGQQPAYAHEFRLLTASGDYRWVLSRGRVVERSAHGEPLRAVGTLIDLTDRQWEEARRREQARREAAHSAQSDMLSRMSHELRTPLNAVLGFAQLLGSRIGQPDLDEQRRYVTHIEEAGWHLLNMVNDVLALTELQAGRLRVEREPLELCALVRAGWAAHRSAALRHQLEWVEPELPASAWVLGDERRVQQVLGNLLSNAIQYNRPGGSVALSLRHQAEAWVLAVTDTGQGIPAAQLPHLFEPFNRLGRPSTGVAGVGVGLVLTRSLLAMMDGTLTVQSTEGQGSCFEISLPRAPDRT